MLRKWNFGLRNSGVAVKRYSGSKRRAQLRYQRGLKMSKSSADCQLALMRNEACQRNIPWYYYEVSPVPALVTIHERREWSDTPRDSRAVALAKSWLKSPVGRSVARSVRCNLYFRPLSFRIQRGWIQFNVPRKCFVIDRVRAALASKCFFRQCQSRSDRQFPPPSILAMLVRDGATLA